MARPIVLTSWGLNLPENDPGVLSLSEEEDLDVRAVEVHRADGTWLKSAAEVRRVAQNCRDGIDSINSPWGYTYRVSTRRENAWLGTPPMLRMTIDEVVHFRGEKPERLEYAESIARLLRMTAGRQVEAETHVKIRSGVVTAQSLRGPWSDRLQALRWATPKRDIRHAVAHSRADVLVIPAKRSKRQAFERKGNRRPRVVTFGDLVDESFAWQVERAIARLVGDLE